MNSSITQLENESFYEDDTAEQPPADIIAYNELRSCADLYRMHRTEILQIRPEFQREIVWPPSAQTRFIDSLVKQLPIPSMCFSLDYKNQRWQVIDGLQRMATIVRFLSGEEWRLSKLDDIDPALSGKALSLFLDPNSELHKYYTRIENLSLPITVIRCDYSKKNHVRYLFTIFHRLNAGGMRLNNQEIRNCIFSGPFNNLLKELNKSHHWMKLNKMKATSGYRFTTEELILRFFAFHNRYKKYNGRLAGFLNDYMDDHKDADAQFIDEKRRLFNSTVEIVYNKIFEGKVPERQSITIFEATFVGVAFNIEFLEKAPIGKVQALYKKLLSHEELSEEKLKEGIAGKPRVLGRIAAAESIMSGN